MRIVSHDNSHEISCLMLFLKKQQIFICCVLQIIGGALWINTLFILFTNKK